MRPRRRPSRADVLDSAPVSRLWAASSLTSRAKRGILCSPLRPPPSATGSVCAAPSRSCCTTRRARSSSRSRASPFETSTSPRSTPSLWEVQPRSSSDRLATGSTASSSTSRPRMTSRSMRPHCRTCASSRPMCGSSACTRPPNPPSPNQETSTTAALALPCTDQRWRLAEMRRSTLAVVQAPCICVQPQWTAGARRHGQTGRGRAWTVTRARACARARTHAQVSNFTKQC
mmetsp:Transcript_31553/g.67861  ORF Transcript_31553/g.67861 Transcript_31553/m.67861 type:complete len:231 (+) Transcript_31553:483-1175(+)